MLIKVIIKLKKKNKENNINILCVITLIIYLKKLIIYLNKYKKLFIII